MQSISLTNTQNLEELKNLHLYDFGIYLELEPDDEEKAMLEQNIQVALQSGQIYLEDAIDIREVKNITLANQILKYRRIQKQKQDQAAQEKQIQAQAQANMQQSEQAALNEVQKQEALAKLKYKLNKLNHNLKYKEWSKKR